MLFESIVDTKLMIPSWLRGEIFKLVFVSGDPGRVMPSSIELCDDMPDGHRLKSLKAAKKVEHWAAEELLQSNME